MTFRPSPLVKPEGLLSILVNACTIRSIIVDYLSRPVSDQ